MEEIEWIKGLDKDKVYVVGVNTSNIPEKHVRQTIEDVSEAFRKGGVRVIISSDKLIEFIEPKE